MEREVKLGGQIYEVDKILKEKSTEAGRKLYYVKWVGYSNSANTWEPSRNILTPIVLEEWKTKKGKAKKASVPEMKKPKKTKTEHKKVGRRKTKVTKMVKKTVKKAAKKAAEKKSVGKRVPLGALSDEGDKVEDECPLKGSCTVYSDGGSYTVTLNAASRVESHSKFYILQLLDGDDGAFHVWTRWGRVGHSGVSKLMGPYPLKEAKGVFTTKFKAKTGNNWENRATFETKSGKYTLLGFDVGEDDSAFDSMMERFRANPNEGKELVSQADEASGEKVQSVRTHIWQYYVDDGVDGKMTDWYNYEEKASDVVEFAFKDWRRNPSVNVRAIKSGTYTYSVNFNTMEQTNIEHRNHTKRVIRRVVFRPLKRSNSFLSFD